VQFGVWWKTQKKMDIVRQDEKLGDYVERETSKEGR